MLNHEQLLKLIREKVEHPRRRGSSSSGSRYRARSDHGKRLLKDLVSSGSRRDPGQSLRSARPDEPDRRAYYHTPTRFGFVVPTARSKE